MASASPACRGMQTQESSSPRCRDEGVAAGGSIGSSRLGVAVLSERVGICQEGRVANRDPRLGSGLASESASSGYAETPFGSNGHHSVGLKMGRNKIGASGSAESANVHEDPATRSTQAPKIPAKRSCSKCSSGADFRTSGGPFSATVDGGWLGAHGCAAAASDEEGASALAPQSWSVASGGDVSTSSTTWLVGDPMPGAGNPERCVEAPLTAPASCPVRPQNQQRDDGGNEFPSDAFILQALGSAGHPLTLREVYLLSMGKDPTTEHMGIGVKSVMNRRLHAMQKAKRLETDRGLWSLPQW